jgi:uncharacterized protein YyaL (SSP411 family)
MPSHPSATDSPRTNGLNHTASSYLRSAMHQPVDWQPWGPEAFARARAADKPVLLDIGAVWCHWCHVMDRESYEDAETAEIINSHYVAIKVDRDERPDVDARFQAAVSAMSGQGGWPLTAILTPEGQPFFGGTYFPKDDRYGRPGFKRVLLTIAHAYHEQREEVLESAASVIAAIEHNESFSGHSSALQATIVQSLIDSALQQFDRRFGGFGTQPKFPHPTILDLLTDHAARTGDEAAAIVVRVTLDRMAAGGMYDHLAGGFHRYSVDERWVVPHFEKMSYDNSELLRSYVRSYRTFGDEEHARVARETVGWMDAVLSDQQRGGFYASQDADISLDDDGDYYTWTQQEAAAVLTPAEMAIASVYYDIGELGDMHHNPQKNTLHAELSLAEAARRAAQTVEEAQRNLDAARKKLHAARLARPTPYVDRTMYANWNALAVSAYLEAASVLQLPEAQRFALRSLDRLLDTVWDAGTRTLTRVIAYGEGERPEQTIAGMLDDYAATGLACLDAWAAAGTMRYFTVAEQVASVLMERFRDAERGGFFDTPQTAGALSVLAARRKPLQDSPTPAGNSLAAMLLLRLAELNGRDDFEQAAVAALQSFAGVAGQFGLYAGAYGLALRRYLEPPVQVCIVDEDAAAEALRHAAERPFLVNRTVVRLTAAQIENRELPPLLAETLPHLPELHQARSFAVVCSGRSCQPAVFTPESLAQTLRGPEER